MLIHLETDAPYVTSRVYPLHLASSVDAFKCQGVRCVQPGQLSTNPGYAWTASIRLYP